MFVIGDIIRTNGNDWCTYEIIGLERLKARDVRFAASKGDVEIIAAKLKLHDDSKIPRDEYPNYTTQVGKVHEALVDTAHFTKV